MQNYTYVTKKSRAHCKRREALFEPLEAMTVRLVFERRFRTQHGWMDMRKRWLREHAMERLEIRDLGRMPYREALSLQRSLQA